MNKIVTTTVVFLVPLVLAIFSQAPVSAQETAGQILAKLNKLPGEKRQQVLAEKASRGEVTFYSSLQSSHGAYSAPVHQAVSFREGQRRAHVRRRADQQNSNRIPCPPIPGGRHKRGRGTGGRYQRVRGG